jgi:subtilisin family serine protease
VKNYLIFFSLILTTSVFTQTPFEKFSEEIKSKIKNENEKHLVWIYFTNKGTDVENYLINPETVISKKSVVRREKVLSKKNIIDYTDIPVNQNYINEIISSGFRVKHKSKWFNAVSGYATTDELKKISELSFVKNIDVVRKFKDQRIDIDETKIKTVNKTNLQPEGVHTYNYGQSYTQSAISNIPQVHDLGYKANGITICLMDAGFANLSHEVFQNMNIMAMYDFVAGSTTMVGHQHGTATLSLIGGFKEGQLIGPAFGANFILARTENDPGSETPVEEDNWIAAMEWADSIGVDVTSTSLGYLTFDPPYKSYTWQDMDGNTAIITKGADIAARKGIVVVNSAGNSGYDPNHNTLGAPADGDSVITIGSVDASGNRASYSSVGPTVDGRIKPDLMAMGMGTYIATIWLNGYSIGWPGGTSYACPIAAGVAALLLSVNPSLTPMEILDILRQTASNSSSPDNLIGWGIVDALAAVNLVLTDVKQESVPDNYFMLSNYPNPFNPSTTIRYSVPEDGVTKIKLYNVLGKEVITLLDEAVSKGTHELTLDGKNLTSGVYFLSLISGKNLKTIKISLIK